MPTIYSILNKKTQDWWHNKELRKNGRIKEARNRERQSIRSTTSELRETLKNRGYLSIGQGGWRLHISNNETLSHYGGIDEPIPQCCLKLGIPIIDTTGLDLFTLLKVIKVPMVDVDGTKKDKLPYHSCSFAPLDYVISEFEKLGAAIYNWDIKNKSAKQSGS